jgi:hypothetical protein
LDEGKAPQELFALDPTSSPAFEGYKRGYWLSTRGHHDLLAGSHSTQKIGSVVS